MACMLRVRPSKDTGGKKGVSVWVSEIYSLFFESKVVKHDSKHLEEES